MFDYIELIYGHLFFPHQRCSIRRSVEQLSSSRCISELWKWKQCEGTLSSHLLKMEGDTCHVGLWLAPVCTRQKAGRGKAGIRWRQIESGWHTWADQSWSCFHSVDFLAKPPIRVIPQGMVGNRYLSIRLFGGKGLSRQLGIRMVTYHFYNAPGKWWLIYLSQS